MGLLCAYFTTTMEYLIPFFAIIGLHLIVFSMAQISDQRECFEATIYGLKTANCERKNLKAIPDDLDRNTQVLKFNENHLTYLQMDEFKPYKALQEIYFVRNRIEMMAPDAFRGLHNLQILNLEENKLTELPTSAFKHLRSVRILILKSNQLKYIASKAFKDLPNIEELNFENNYLERIDSQAFQGLSKLIEVNLANNELKGLSVEMANYLPAGTLSIFRLYQNPWVCDCKLRWLNEWLAVNKVNWDFGTNTPACNEPELIHSIEWEDLLPNQFACASQIIANSSTSIQLQVGSNITIECVVRGDPVPKITWQKDSNYISKENVRDRTFMHDGEKQIRSSLYLADVSENDVADYRCIAENPAGRSEVTYKVWIADSPPSGITKYVPAEGIGQGALIGIGVGALIVVLLVIILVVCIFKKSKTGNNRPYVMREYKKANNHNQVDNNKVDKALYQMDMNDDSDQIKPKEPASPIVNVAHTELLLGKEPSRESDDLELETENGSKPQNHIQVQSEPKTTEFKMKIFTSYSGDEGEQKELASLPDRLEPSNRVSTGDTGLTVDGNNPIREATPDLLCDDKHSRSNHKTPTPPPPPAAYYVNHVASLQKRAEENPYAKPSELKQGGQKTPDSSETLLDYTKTLDRPSGVSGVSSASGVVNNRETPTSPKAVVIVSPKSTHKETSKEGGRYKQDSKTDSTSCTNPVCMKAHNRSKSHTEAPMSPRSRQGHGSPNKGHITSSHSAGSLSDLECSDSSEKRGQGRKRGSDHQGGRQHHGGAPEDRYKTLPCRGSQGGRGSPGGRKLPVTPMNSSSSSTAGGPPVMHSEKSATHRPRVQFASPVHSPSSSVSSTPTSPRLLPQSGGRHLPLGSSATMGRPSSGNPLHPKGLKVMSPEGPRTLTFPGAIETLPPTATLNQPPTMAPPGSSKPSRTYGCSTSIDDLLSPPFAHLNPSSDSNKGQTATIKRSGVTLQSPRDPKPGHKDEYGTAV